MRIEEFLAPEQMRELGKAIYLDDRMTEEERANGLQLIINAHRKGDMEATYIISRLVLSGTIKFAGSSNNEEYAMTLLYKAADRGYVPARVFLNDYCETRYRSMVTDNLPDDKKTGRLVDFEGKPIRIKREGLFTPIDAVLEYEDGCNVLTLSTNIRFVYTQDMDNKELFEEAVISGILSWQGEYEVFGGQKLSVRVKITTDNNLFDNVLVVPVSELIKEDSRQFAKAAITDNHKKNLKIVSDTSRSLATIGIKWSVTSRKLIYIQSEDGKFEDYEEIRHVAKHEFGHALGLGDLYESREDSYPGVPEGTYRELDGYLISDRFYNLVMCDHHGPISNNDIEMIVLAFSENEMQHYQKSKNKVKISSALGKGN